jgi:hypothetical protein
MSTEYVIENDKTRRSLYCTRDFSAIEPEHLIGDALTIEHNLIKHLQITNEEYKLKYAKWASHVIATFIGGASAKDIDIHDDSYFFYREWQHCDTMYMSEEELDEWARQDRCNDYDY